MARTALITGVGRDRSIGAGIARGCAKDGWNLVLSHWWPYDERLGYEGTPQDVERVAADCRALGSQVRIIAADLADTDVPDQLVSAAAESGELTGLVMSHCESVDSSVMTTSLASWDRHYAVNVRAAWLLIRAFASRFPVRGGSAPTGRIIALTSDHSAFNTPYGTSKGALDRLIVAAAVELADRGIRANAINPGPVDTGWMSDEIRASGLAQTPAGRLGTPRDTADLVRFLLGEGGGWITGQVLYSNGGFATG